MKTCERCGAEFGCGAVGEIKILPAQYKEGLCPACLLQIFANPSIEKSDLKAGSDFYYERGLMVFTKEYHLKRGECCNSGCRHCPY